MASVESIKTTYLITGASSGIGLELVKQLVASEGNHVFATVRKRGSSLTGVDEISNITPATGSSVTIVEGIDVSNDNVGEILTPQLNGTKIDVVIHNAGSLNGTREVDSSNLMAEQNLASVTMDRMRAAFEVNTLGPLRVQKALMDENLMKTKTTNTTDVGDDDGDGSCVAVAGKVIVISTGFGSISENTSGGNYAYRTSKAGVNMITKGLSCDLKKVGVSVRAIAPGFVATEFGPGKEKMASWGGMPVEESCGGILALVEDMTMENTGEFHCVKKEGPAKEMPW